VEEKLLAKEVKLNLGNNIEGTFDVWIDKEGKLEIIPYTRVGDLCSHSYVMYYNKYDEDYKLAYRQYDDESIEN
jgi:hypothetical protein